MSPPAVAVTVSDCRGVCSSREAREQLQGQPPGGPGVGVWQQLGELLGGGGGATGEEPHAVGQGQWSDGHIPAGECWEVLGFGALGLVCIHLGQLRVWEDLGIGYIQQVRVKSKTGPRVSLALTWMGLMCDE